MATNQDIEYIKNVIYVQVEESTARKHFTRYLVSYFLREWQHGLARCVFELSNPLPASFAACKFLRLLQLL